MNRLLKITIISCLCFAGMSTLGFKAVHQKLHGSIATIVVHVDNSIENEVDSRFNGAFLFNNNVSLNEAARINCRYHERLAAFDFLSNPDLKRESSPNNWDYKKLLFTLRLNNSCLSSYYDYIFLFTLF